MPQETEYFYLSRSEMLPFLPEKYNRILEIGCGAGNFSSLLKSDCEKWGIEPYKPAAETASAKLTKVLVGRYFEVSNHLPDFYFDLVICNDVIEHMEDHDVFLESIKTKMAPDGILIGSIPNVRFYKNLIGLIFNRDWNYTEEGGILDRSHLRFFTEKSIKRTLESHGFRIEKFQGLNKLEFTNFGIQKIQRFIFVNFLIILSLGSYKDILYLQFGFRVKK